MKNKKKIVCAILALIMVLTCFAPLQAERVSAKSSKLNKTQMTLYPGEYVKLTVSGVKNVKWTSSNSKVASVSKKGTITAKAKGGAKITAKAGKATYTCKVTVKKKPAVTRGEWIAALLKQTGIQTTSVKSYHFSDTKKDKNGKAIETAYGRNILPVTKGTKKFSPNRPATREFMAVTTVRAMGFKADSSVKPKCSDKGKLKYASEDQVALNQNFISLKKGKFLPTRALTKAEKKKALAAIRKIQKSEKIDSSHKDTIKYQKEVVQQPLNSEDDYAVATSGNDLVVTIPKNENTEKIQNGKVAVFPEQSEMQGQVALKVTSVSDDGNGNYRIVGQAPDISEVYKTIDVQETTKADMSDFESNSEVVASANVSSSKSMDSMRKGALQTVTATIGEATTLTLKETKLGNSGSIKGSIELSAPKISAIVDVDLSNPAKPVYNQVTVTLEEDVTTKATLQFSSKGSGAEKIYLGHVTGNLGYGLFVDVLCYLNISADGTATVQYTLANEVSVSYINGNIRMDADSDGSWEGTKAEITGQILGEPQVNLRVLGYWFDDKLYGEIPLIGVQADFGPKFTASVKMHDTTPKTCTSLSIYSYLSVGLNTDSGLGAFLKKHTKLKLSKAIWDDAASNSLRVTWHYEDGARSKGDKCTYKKSENDIAKKQLNEKAHKAFMKQVKSDKEKYGSISGEKLKYLFVDLNGDKIDELITYPGYGTQIVYAYKGGKVNEIIGFDHSEINYYFKKTGVIYVTGATMRTIWGRYYNFDNGIFECIADYKVYGDQNFFDESTSTYYYYDTYYIKGKEVSYVKYQEYVKSLEKGEKIDFSEVRWDEY